jgi:hypothetical protein
VIEKSSSSPGPATGLVYFSRGGARRRRHRLDCRGGCAEIRVVNLGDLQFLSRVPRQATHFGIDRLRDLAERQGAVGAGNEYPSVHSFDVLDRRFEQVRGRSNHFFLEQPRRQRGRSASQDCAAACIGPGAVRNDGAVPMQGSRFSLLPLCSVRSSVAFGGTLRELMGPYAPDWGELPGPGAQAGGRLDGTPLAR